MLGNSTRKLPLIHKWLLCRICVLPIILYKFQLWYFKGALLYQSLNFLRKIQKRVVLWITEVFYILMTWRVKAIASLIPIYFLLDKIIG